MKKVFNTAILAALSGLLMLTASPFGAQAQIKMKKQDATVKSCLEELQKEYGYSFVIPTDAVDISRSVSVDFNDATIESVLSKLFENRSDIRWTVEGRNVILSLNRQPESAPQTVSQPGKPVYRGKVIDENGEPMIGVAVEDVATGRIVITDYDGFYEIDAASPRSSLKFTFMGYLTQNQEVQTGKDATVALIPDLVRLDESVVVGYGVQNRRDVTTSIASMKAADFENSSATDFRQAMAGKMPGVQVTSLGGQPEGNVSVRIRGIQSATSGNDPLYVIDGVQSDSRAFANLDSNEIESLEVLKDASSAAIYGSKGSCGVILVTTKRGAASETPVISYDGYFSLGRVSKKYDMLNAYEFAQMYKESRDGSYLYNVPTGTISDPYLGRPQTYHMVPDCLLPYLNGESGLTDTDWQNEVLRTALSHKHSLSIGAKTKNYSYFIAANYLYREGIVIGSDFKRFGIRANLDGRRGNFKYGLSFSPSYSRTHHINSDSQYGSGDGVIASMLMCPPIYKPYNEDGSYNWDMNGTPLRSAVVEGVGGKDTQSNAVLNPVALALEIKDLRSNINLMGNVWLSYEFFKGFEYKFTAGGDGYFYNRDYYRPSTLPMPGNWKYNYESYTPTAINTKTNYLHWTISNQISFNREFGDHRINAIAVFEAEKRTTSSTSVTATGTAGDDKITTTYGKNVAVGDAYNNLTGNTFASWLTRAQYSYKSKYMLSASIRGDASSRFAPGNRWGYFPAASLGWRISSEPFMANLTFLNDLKIRASVGQTGNAQIGDYEYLALYTVGTKELGNGLQPALYASQIANNNLGWEKNTSYDVGFDASMFDGLLSLNADFYYTKTTDMLFDVPVSALTGFSTASSNVGSMENKGLELTLGSAKVFHNGFSYSFSSNFSLNRNKVLSLGGGDNTPLIVDASYTGAQFITQVGQPIGSYYLMVADGIFHDKEELNSYPHEATTQVGDYRFVDVNGDGKIEQETDRAIVGNYMPDFYYGFTFQLAYKGFDLGASFQGVYGNEILNIERRYLCGYSANNNSVREELTRFPFGEGLRETRKPTGYSQSWISTAFLEDGSYFRLQNLSFGYTIPDRCFKRTGIRKFRVYLQGSNLFTLTNYTGYNPEVNKNSSNALKPGEDYCSYPLQRTFTIGLNFSL